MNLQNLLKQNLKSLTPEAGIVIKKDGKLSAQTVVYQPQVLNLGAVLLAYYTKISKIKKLRQLGDCLSVGHYIQSPRALRCGLDFANDPIFENLPAKMQKHLTGELQDCTIAYSRDLEISRPPRHIRDVNQFLSDHIKLKYIYLYQNHRWQIIRLNGQSLRRPVLLRNKISQLLKKA